MNRHQWEWTGGASASNVKGARVLKIVKEEWK